MVVSRTPPPPLGFPSAGTPPGSVHGFSSVTSLRSNNPFAPSNLCDPFATQLLQDRLQAVQDGSSSRPRTPNPFYVNPAAAVRTADLTRPAVTVRSINSSG